jgi:phosphoserine phosphatase
MMARCAGPSELTNPIRETVLLRDRAAHRICAERHGALVGWAEAFTAPR